ncbi:MAG: DUF393 domain-containing protein [Arenicella sp.]|nr:DUF393 domain-containing protein [Arenicella sp.]
MSSGATENDIALVYDTQCPVCSMYCRMVRLRQSVGELRLVDARHGGSLVDEITARGWDIDQGMVLKLQDELYYGADAIHALSLISSRSGVFNRLNFWIFKTPTVAKLLYPLLRGGRNLLLKVLRRNKINNLAKPGNDQF